MGAWLCESLLVLGTIALSIVGAETLRESLMMHFGRL